MKLSIAVHGDGAWPDLVEKLEQLTWLRDEGDLAIARLPAGLSSGASSVAIRIDLPDGQVIVAQTSLGLFLQAADAFRAAEGEKK